MKVSVEVKKADGTMTRVRVPAYLTKSSVAVQLLRQGRVGASPSLPQADLDHVQVEYRKLARGKRRSRVS